MKSSKDTNKIEKKGKEEEKLEEIMGRDLLPLTFRYRWKDKQKEGGETNGILGLVGTVLSYHSMTMLNRRPWV